MTCTTPVGVPFARTRLEIDQLHSSNYVSVMSGERLVKTRRTDGLDPVCAIVGEPENAIVRVRYEGLCTRFSSDTLCLDTSIGNPVQSLPSCPIGITIGRERSRFLLQKHLRNNGLIDGVVGDNAGYKG